MAEKIVVKMAICDDVKEVCVQLEQLLIPAFGAIGKECDIDQFETGEAFCREFTPDKYEIVFLDIELTGMNGLEVSRQIREVKADEYTQIVYISGKTGYAMELFEYHPLYFLTKPFQQERVEWLVKKYQKIVKQDDQLFYYKVGRERHSIPLEKILYFKSKGRKIILYTTDKEEKEILFYGSMKQIYPTMKAHRFLWIHQSLLVNYHHVKYFTYDKVLLVDGTILQISQARRPDIREQIESYMEET